MFDNGFFQIKVSKVGNLDTFLGETYVIEDRISSGCLAVYTKSDQKIRLHDA